MLLAILWLATVPPGVAEATKEVTVLPGGAGPVTVTHYPAYHGLITVRGAGHDIVIRPFPPSAFPPAVPPAKP